MTPGSTTAAATPARDSASLRDLRKLLRAAEYSGPSIQERLGTEGDLLVRTSDHPVHLRRLEGDPSALAALVRLFVLVADMDAEEADRALQPLGVDGLERLRLVESEGAIVRARVRLVPHDELVVASDLPGDLGAEHVASVHHPSATLGYLTVRRPVERALDLCTGCGIQALLASRHAGLVVATDVNERALEFAAFNAAVNGVENLELRHGSFLEPVRGEEFGLVVCNPPYVISPEFELLFRDSGLGGDRVSAELVQELPSALEEGGFGTVMVSWVQEGDDATVRPRGWVEGTGCDAWVFHASTDDPLTTAGGWLRDAATPEDYGERIDRWVDYYRSEGIVAVAYGAVVMRRRSDADVWVRATSFPQAGIAPASDHLERLFTSQDELSAIGDAELLDRTVALVDRLSLEHALGREDGGWTTSTIAIALQEGLGFRAGLDQTTAEIVRRLDPPRPLRAVLGDVAAELGVNQAALAEAGSEFARNLLELGFAVLQPDRR